ncbi:hypothetical protein L596_029604 [Steinernema carpocapsae]|uniref:Tetratricopeptide SHNi-TPR domain-containing protein n=1 Tax=Steinernema carpocapsae TaxID=34508 RepID=A0A4U5LV49_STECR|nr:hypothetical protein L596_029604 [Steinernema carpocapsae]
MDAANECFRTEEFNKLFAAGKQHFVRKNFKEASEHLSEALIIADELFGDFGVEGFDAKLLYAKAMAEITRAEDQMEVDQALLAVLKSATEKKLAEEPKEAEAEKTDAKAEEEDPKEVGANAGEPMEADAEKTEVEEPEAAEAEAQKTEAETEEPNETEAEMTDAKAEEEEPKAAEVDAEKTEAEAEEPKEAEAEKTEAKTEAEDPKEAEAKAEEPKEAEAEEPKEAEAEKTEAEEPEAAEAEAQKTEAEAEEPKEAEAEKTEAKGEEEEPKAAEADTEKTEAEAEEPEAAEAKADEEADEDESMEAEEGDADESQEADQSMEDEEQGNAEVAFQMFDICRLICDKQLQNDPKSEHWLYRKANVLMDAGEFAIFDQRLDQAREDISEAVRVLNAMEKADPIVHAAAYMMYGRACLDSKEYAEAAKHYEKVQEILKAYLDKPEEEKEEANVKDATELLESSTKLLEDARNSMADYEKANEAKKAAFVVEPQFANAEVNDITGMIRKGIKRPAEGAPEEDTAKKTKTEESTSDQENKEAVQET